MIISDHRIVIPWVSSRCEFVNPGAGSTGLGLVQHGRMVAGVVYDRFTGRSIFASIAIDPGHYLDREFVWAICDYPFNQLGVERIVVTINSSNAKSVRLAKHLGFVLTASIPGLFYDGDMLLATLDKSDCKWLGKYYGRKIQGTKST